MPLTPQELQGTVFIDKLVESARDLIENPDAIHAEYTRGQLELIHDVTGISVEELRDIMFPKLEPLAEYAIDFLGGEPEDVSDWQSVAGSLFNQLHPTEPDASARLVTFHLVREPGDDPDYRFQVRVTMAWVKDGDNLPRQENAHGDTIASAYRMARAIAAAFMYEESVDSESWPPNEIDHLPMN